MAIQKINLGTEPHGVGGDSYRTANEKINSNFEEVGKDIQDVLEVVQTGDFSKTAYDIAVKNGFVGSESQWLNSLIGEKGERGIGLAHVSHNNDDTLTFLFTDNTSYTTRSLRGAQGIQGPEAKSVYDIAVSHGFKGNERDWLNYILENSETVSDLFADADSLEQFINGSDSETVLTRLSSEYPTLQKAIKELFENGGLPAMPFTTKALMESSELVDGDYAVVTDDAVNNGLYVKTAGAWVKSNYDPALVANSYTDRKVADRAVGFETKDLMESSELPDDSYAIIVDDGENNGFYTKKLGEWVRSDYEINNIVDSKLSEVVSVDDGINITHGFVDKNNTLIASFDKNGEFDFYPTADTKSRLNILQENNDDDYVFLITDKDGRILSGIDKDGNQVTKDLNSSGGEMPLKTPISSVNDKLRVKSINLVAEKLALNTIGKGRSTDPDIEINGNGLTHPKMIYIPEGWNGYMYWLTATPTFGVIGGQAAYENPHVWASNDLVNWVEPSGGRIDEPEDNSSWWSDSHLALDDDGWLYCIYRGNYFTFANHCIVAKRSRDGVNWSERIMIFNSNSEPVDGGVLSPAIYKSGSYWHYVDINNSTTALEIDVDYGSRGVFRRTSDKVTGEYTPYSLDTLINYPNKAWGEDQSPWHIDAIKVGNIHLQLIAMGSYTSSMSNELYITYSTDGWNYKSLPKLDIIKDNAYRSSLTLKKVEGNEMHFDMLVARAGTGQIDLFNLVLEVV